MWVVEERFCFNVLVACSVETGRSVVSDLPVVEVEVSICFEEFDDVAVVVVKMEVSICFEEFEDEAVVVVEMEVSV